MIRLDSVKHRFGPQVLFDGLSWAVPSKARLGLVGPNGVGKTTLLRILTGRETPDGGAVHKPRDMRIGFLPQEVETVNGGSVLGTAMAGFGEISTLKTRLEALEQRLAALSPGDPECAALTETYGELRHRFEDLDGHRVESRAKAILQGLAVPAARFHDALETLSGGWRMRVVLARLLLGSPHLLLLDEPTNHLDLEAIGWLEEFLDGWEGAFVVVSHDRYFLNRMARGIVELERGRLTEYPGNYDDFLRAKQERKAALAQAAKQQAREIAKVERFIERFRYKNTKARQVQSRIRALEKLERVVVPDSIKRVRFGLPEAPRSGDVVVRAEGVTKSYGNTEVYRKMDLLLRRGHRVALIGPNGAGKSTLLKMLAGRTSVDDGRLELGHNVSQHYYAQHQLDELNPQASVLQEIERAVPTFTRQQLRSLLGCFLFGERDVDKAVGVLSGGEKARLALARMLAQPANLLLLDEPTNHLDLESREVLEDALNEYQGTMIVISHDRYFINRVTTSIAEVGGGRIELYPGDYDEYLDWKRRRAQEPTRAAASPEVKGPGRAQPRESRREARRLEAEERNRRYRQRKWLEVRLAPIEAEIAELEQRQRALESQQADAAVYANPEKSREVSREKSATDERLAELYAKWEVAADELQED